ncbi:MAG: DUF4190 domain-containing protein [Nocardioidaceae bacterium]
MTTPDDPFRKQPPPGQPGPYSQQPGPYSQQPGQPGPYGQPDHTGQPGYPPPPGYGPQGYLGYPMAPSDHPRAVTALVLGLLGLLLCQLVSPFAWVIGKRTVDEIDADPRRYAGRGQAQAGYILGIVGTILLAAGLVFLVVVLVIAAGVTTSAGHG